MLERTPSGVPAVGELPWGSHFCHFYGSDRDLAETLVPFFKAGLENHEKCLWVASEPLGVDGARAALSAAVPDLPAREGRGEIAFHDARAWYLAGNSLDTGTALERWVAAEHEALDSGYRGLRLTGNTMWLQKHDWAAFVDYEDRVNRAFGQRRMIALCSYCLDHCGGHGVLDVIRTHQFSLARRHDSWEVVESSALSAAKVELQQANARLEHRVAERTEALQKALAYKDVLLHEVHHRVKNNFQVVSSILSLQAMNLPPELRTPFDQAISRIRSMATVHEMLSSSEDGSLDIGPYLAVIARDLESLYGRDRRTPVVVQTDGGSVSLSQALCLGLIANEAITNAYKYAFPEGLRGRIGLYFERTGEDCLLRIADDGIGIAADAQDGNGHGLRLLDGVARQLGGTLAVRRDGGTVVEVRFRAE